VATCTDVGRIFLELFQIPVGVGKDWVGCLGMACLGTDNPLFLTHSVHLPVILHCAQNQILIINYARHKFRRGLGITGAATLCGDN
jgi:hypothetical protein